MRNKKLSLIMCVVLMLESLLVGCGPKEATPVDEPVTTEENQVSVSSSFFEESEMITDDLFEALVQKSTIEAEMAASSFYISPLDESVLGHVAYYKGRKSLIEQLKTEGDMVYKKALELQKHADVIQSNFLVALEAMQNLGVTFDFVDIMISRQSNQIEKVLMSKAEVEVFSESSSSPYVEAWLEEYHLQAQLKFAEEVLTYYTLLEIDGQAYLKSIESFGDEEFAVDRMSLDGALYISPETESLYFDILSHFKNADAYYEALDRSEYFYNLALLEDFVQFAKGAIQGANTETVAGLSQVEKDYLFESLALHQSVAEALLLALQSAGQMSDYTLSVESTTIVQKLGWVAYADNESNNAAYSESLKSQQVTEEAVERKTGVIDAILNVSNATWKLGQKTVGKAVDLTYSTVKSVTDTSQLLTGMKKFDQYKRDMSTNAKIMSGTSGNSIEKLNKNIDQVITTVSDLPSNIIGKNKLTTAIGKVTSTTLKIGVVKVKTFTNLMKDDVSILDVPTIIKNTTSDQLLKEVVGYKKEFVSQAQNIAKNILPENTHKMIDTVSTKLDQVVEVYEKIEGYVDKASNIKTYLKERYIDPEVDKVAQTVDALKNNIKDKAYEQIEPLYGDTTTTERFIDHDNLKPTGKAVENIKNDESIKSSSDLEPERKNLQEEWLQEHLENYDDLNKVRLNYEEQQMLIDAEPEAEEPEAEEAAPEAEELEPGAEEAEPGAEEAEPESEEAEPESEEAAPEAETPAVASIQLAGSYNGYITKVTVDSEFTAPLNQGNSRVSMTLNDAGTGRMSLEIFGTDMMDMNATLEIANPAQVSDTQVAITSSDDEGNPIKVYGTLSNSGMQGRIHIVSEGSNIVLDYITSRN